MKKILFAIAFIVSTCSYAQSQEQEYSVYCEIDCSSNVMRGGVSTEIDFGQEDASRKNKKIVDENGKTIIFNSIPSVLNYMGKRGWNFVQAYVVGNTYTYILTKKVKSDDDITKGFFTRKLLEENSK